MKSRSLGFKLVTGGIAVVLIPLVVVGIFAVNKSGDALLSISKSNAQQMAVGYSDMVDLVLEEETKIVKNLAGSDIVVKAASSVAEYGAEASSVAIGQLDHELEQSGENLGSDYEVLIVADAEGIVFADSLGGQNKGVDIAGRPYFQTALSGKVAISDPVRSKSTGNLVVPLAAPIRADNGKTVGAAVSVLDIDFLTQKITSVKIGETGYPFLVDESGLAVAHPNSDLILDLDISKIPEMAGIFNAMHNQREGVEAYQFNGIDKIAGFAKVDRTDWHLVVTQDEEEFMAASAQIRNIIFLVGALFLAGTVLAVLWFTRSLTKPINRIVEMMHAGATEVSAASAQVSASGQSMAEGASEQAASIEETSSSLEEMSSMTKQNAANANQANSTVTDAKVEIDKANDAMQTLTESMHKISEDSKETQKIVKTIDEIAFQTNLLALNAAVEAARAGEAGAGFAVVADEVRNLALRAADASKNTAEMIDSTVTGIGQGVDLVDKANEAFASVAGGSGKIGELVAEIAAASNEQAQGIEQINTAITEMDKVVQQNAANAEESASAAEEMNAQAEQMEGVVQELVTIVRGQSAAEAVKAADTRQKTRNHGQKTAARRTRKPRQAAPKGQAQPRKKPANSQDAEKVLPLGEENSFADF